MSLALTVGMPTYDDFNGVWMTVQHLRLTCAQEHLRACELVVVDNHPNSADGQHVRDFLKWVKGDFVQARYVPYPDVAGTAAAKGRVFHEAKGQAVLCLDSHVLLEPGALGRLLDYYKQHPDCQDLLQGPLVYDDLRNISTHFRDEWRGEMWGVWDYDPRGDRYRNEYTETPFPVPAQGMGLFSCRKESWLGFNPECRGFGGEEFYIHVKYQQAGRQVLCVPWLRWVHRFGRPKGVPYPLQRLDKVRNYVLGHQELGLSLDPVRQHFVASGLVSEMQWREILASTRKPGSPPPPSPPPPSSPPAKHSCCGGGTTQVVLSLESWYDQAARTASDIHEHVPRLRDLARQAEHVVVLGGHHHISTVALLAGQPKRLTVCDMNPPSMAIQLQAVQGTCQVRFLRGDTRTLTLPEDCDLLFIDTKHTADYLYAELLQHAPHCRRRIALHDTAIYGERGEDGGPGLLPAVRRYLKENNSWSVITHVQNNNGFTVMSRDPDDKKPLPSLTRMAWNYTKALAQHTATGSKILNPEGIEQRLAVCMTCDQRNGNRCALCGCYLDASPDGKLGKTGWQEQLCPLGKWPV